MTAPHPASLVDFLLGLASTPAGQASGRRFSVEGLRVGSGAEGGLEIGIARLATESLRLASGPLLLEVGQLALHEVVAQVRIEQGQPRLVALQAGGAELTDFKVQGPLDVAAPPAGAGAHGHGMRGSAAASAWSLAPLAGANGTIHAEIVDATLVFDADVRVPIRQGLVDFNAATVAHVGPDSRMGVSRLGLYVDAPNGRSYLYQFASAPVAGVEYEQRSPLPGPWGSKRGSLRLQPFGEGLLRQSAGGAGHGLTEQARQLLARTTVAGHLQLGDGRLAAPAGHADLVLRAAGDNIVRLKSQAVGRGLAVDVASLSVGNAGCTLGGFQLACDDMAGALELQLSVEGAQLAGALQLARLKMSALRLAPTTAQQ